MTRFSSYTSILGDIRLEIAKINKFRVQGGRERERGKGGERESERERGRAKRGGGGFRVARAQSSGKTTPRNPSPWN